MQARDARFDGQFIAGVHSTGIYCRPSCPAVAAEAGNVSFYRTAAAAHEAGLRACKRCQPDAVPGSPEWNLRDDLASRAMRLIADGVVEREGVPGLAAPPRVHAAAPHPRAHRRARRRPARARPRAPRADRPRAARRDRRCPSPTSRSPSGFGSIRQFNDTIRAVYERSPLELRMAARCASGASAARRAPPAPVDAHAAEPRAGCRAARRAPAAARARAVRRRGRVRLARDPGARGRRAGRARCTTPARSRLPGGPALVRFERRRRRPRAVDRRRGAARDPRRPAAARRPRAPPVRPRRRRRGDRRGPRAPTRALAASVAAVPGIRVPGASTPTSSCSAPSSASRCRSSAATHGPRPARRRRSASASTSARGPTTRRRCCSRPPAAIADRGCSACCAGPAARIRTIVDVARRLDAGDLVVAPQRERAELRADLLAVPGIGPWTAGYVAMRVTRAPDVLLTGDLALRNGAAALGLPADAAALAGRAARGGRRGAATRRCTSGAPRRDRMSAAADGTMRGMAVTDEAILRIKEMILAGELAPGDRLPPEKELSERLGLSRSSLREAVKALEVIRVLDVRRGDGTYVTSLEPRLLLEAMSFVVDLHDDQSVLEIFAVRRILEPAASALAARQRRRRARSPDAPRRRRRASTTRPTSRAWSRTTSSSTAASPRPPATPTSRASSTRSRATPCARASGAASRRRTRSTAPCRSTTPSSTRSRPATPTSPRRSPSCT